MYDELPKGELIEEATHKKFLSVRMKEPGRSRNLGYPRFLSTSNLRLNREVIVIGR
jgi:hypothetical protein